MRKYKSIIDESLETWFTAQRASLHLRRTRRRFLSRTTMLQRDLAVGGVSVRLSVCLSHCDNASQLMIIGLSAHFFHHRVAQTFLVF